MMARVPVRISTNSLHNFTSDAELILLDFHYSPELSAGDRMQPLQVEPSW